MENNHSKKQFSTDTNIVNSQDDSFSLSRETQSDILLIEHPKIYFDCNITDDIKRRDVLTQQKATIFFKVTAINGKLKTIIDDQKSDVHPRHD